MTQVYIENTKLFKNKLNQRIKDLEKKTVQLPQNDVVHYESVEDFCRSDEYTINIWGGKQPLHIAAELGRLNIVKKIVESGENINVKNNYGWTPLHYAARREHPLVVRYLIENKALINEQDVEGFTCLTWAAIKGNKEIAEYLCLNNAAVNLKSKSDMTPLDYAELCDNTEVYKILEKYS